MTRLRRPLIAACLFGALAGAAFALFHRQHARAAAAPPIVGVLAAQPAKPLVQLATPSNVSVAGRVADPAGGPPWTLRSFETRYIPDGAHPRRQACVQLGRLKDRRFGWVVPGVGWRPARFTTTDAPISCAPATALHGGGFSMNRAIVLSGSRAAQRAPAATVVWGRLGRRLASITLADGTRLLPNSARTFVAIRPGERQRWASGTAVYLDGRRRGFHTRHDRPPRFRLDDATVAATAPDPGGGPSWAVVHPRNTPARCLVGPGRLVGHHVGTVDPYLGVFWPDTQLSPAIPGIATGDGTEPITGTCSRPLLLPTARRPVALDVRVVALHDEDPVSRVQLREPDGRTVIVGRAAADVTSVAVNGRTTVPAGVSRAIVMVEPGTSPSGEFHVLVHLRDGRKLFWPLDVATG